MTPVAAVCGPDEECDCVAYGTYTGENGPFGAATLGLAPGRALKKIFFGNNFLWAANGTDVPNLMDNCRDYVRGMPLPVNNAGDLPPVPPDDPAALLPNAAYCPAG